MFDWRLKVCVLMFLMLLPWLGYGQSNRYVFSHLTVNDGLPQTNLRDIFKDSRDFIGFVAMEELPDMMA